MSEFDEIVQKQAEEEEKMEEERIKKIEKQENERKDIGVMILMPEFTAQTPPKLACEVSDFDGKSIMASPATEFFGMKTIMEIKSIKKEARKKENN